MPISVRLIDVLSPPYRHGDENGGPVAINPKPPLHCAKETVKRSRVSAVDSTHHNLKRKGKCNVHLRRTRT